MTIVKNLLGSGIPGGAAQSITGRVSLAQTASGASQGAQAMANDIVVFTSSTANYGPTLPATSAPGDTYTVANNTVNTIKVWPASGFYINLNAQNAALSIATNLTATFTSLGNGNWISNLSA